MILGSALIVWFFSEMFFVNEGEILYAWSTRGPSWDLVGFTFEFLLIFILFYLLPVLWLLMPIHVFRIRSPWALVLAGALTGWAIEGILPILYLELPLSIVWPSVSWHLLVDVILGWWLLRLVLGRNRHLLTAAVFGALGLFWGLWATWYWPTEGTRSRAEFTEPMSSADFAFLAFSSTAVLIVGYLLVDRVGRTTFAPGRRATWAWLISTALLVLLLAGVFAPVFLVLVGPTMLVLRANARTEHRDPLFAAFRPGVTIPNSLLMLTMPATASLTYPWYLTNDVSIGPVLWLFTGPLILGGTGLFVAAVVIILGRARAGADGSPMTAPSSVEVSSS